MLGNVTFCVATAPTVDRTQGHRLAMHMLDELIATPNRPVSAQRAIIEKVICKSR
jgi:hypothetical protein